MLADTILEMGLMSSLHISCEQLLDGDYGSVVDRRYASRH